MKDTLKFQKDFETGNVICFPLGRLLLASGNVIRLHYSPTGLKIGLEKISLENGDVTLFDSNVYAPGLMEMPNQSYNKSID